MKIFFQQRCVIKRIQVCGWVLKSDYIKSMRVLLVPKDSTLKFGSFFSDMYSTYNLFEEYGGDLP